MARHEKNKNKGKEHIDRPAEEIINIMRERVRKQEESEKTTNSPGVPTLQEAMPQKFLSPDGTQCGIMHNAKVAWVDQSEHGEWQFGQDSKFGVSWSPTFLF